MSSNITSTIMENSKNIIIIIIGLVIIYFILSYFFKPAVTLTSQFNAERKQTISSSIIPPNITSNYTYSVWFYVNDWNYKFGEEKILLDRNNSNTTYFPRISLGKIQNDLQIDIAYYNILNTDTSNPEFGNHSCNVLNVPLQKWVNIIITTYGKTLDVYMQGKLVKTCVLPGVPYINNEKDLIVTPNGGFKGYTAKFQYLGNSVNPEQAYDIYKAGYGGNIFGDLFNKYKIKVSYLKDNEEKGSIEI
jgi:hypothetical protein